MDSHLLLHFVATLRYRASKILAESPEGFPAYSAGSEVRTPLEILAHMGDVLTFARKRIEGDDTFPGQRSVPAVWAGEIDRFEKILCAVEKALEAATPLDAELAERLLQGPFADTMTHVGQLAMLRRMAGSPVPGENFFAARVRLI